MMHAIAIDDELPALQIIELFCNRSGFIQLEKTFQKPTEGLKYANKYPVDLLFLDIHMPSLSGIDLYRKLNHEIMVIFSTAHSDYAVEGFNLNAIDYLLKPFSYERFLQAISKAQTTFKQKHQSAETPDRCIYVRADYSLIRIDLDQILFVEGLDDYLKIHLATQKPVVVRMTIKSLQEKLPEPAFMRIHRSYLVATDKIQSIRGKMIQIGSEEIPIGSCYEKNFLDRFQ